jgi:hypothetical protein
LKNFNKKINQSGGSIKIQDPKNNPYKIYERPLQEPEYKVTQSSNNSYNNSSKDLTKNNQNPAKTYQEKSPLMQKQPTATLNIYPPQAQKQSGLEITPHAPLPFAMNDGNKNGFPQFYDPYGPKMHSDYSNFGGPNAIPIGFIKNYNINTDSIHQYQTRYLPIIYEDSIPLRGAKHDLTTISERKLLYEYIKNNLTEYEEGEEGCLNHNSGKNLLRQLKYLSPNPVNYNTLYTNPLQGLRMGVRIYRSCYPIATDRSYRTICQKGSLGVHIRFYNKNFFESNHNNSDKNDMIRELEFYKWVRATILLKNVCPNFIMLYTYYNCATCSEPFSDLDKSKISRPMHSPFVLNVKPKGVLKPQQLNTQCLIMMTEAPQMNLLEWMNNERSYAVNKKLHNNYGYHTSEEWNSIYFQIFAAMYVLDKSDIIINDFNYDNIWVKNVPAIGYWEYIIDNVSFYIQNCGYLVLIDCSFQKKINTLNEPSIYSHTLFKDEPTSNTIDSNWDNILNMDPFGRGYTNIGIRLPPSDIIDKIKKCAIDYKQDKNSLKNIIYKNFGNLLHQRIGEELRSNELQSLQNEDFANLDLQNYRRGELVVYVPDDSSNYKWALYLGNNKICIDTYNVSEKTISESDIRKTNLTARDIYQTQNNLAFNADLSGNPLSTYVLS